MLEVIDKGRTSSAHPVPLLFVHGGWHAAWCWDDHFLDFFANRGFRAAAVSLRGHGGSPADRPLNACSLSDYVDDVRSAAAELCRSPVVVGHSMGGFVAQEYLEANEAPAAVLLAAAPPRGVRGPSLRMLRRHPWAVVKANTFGSTHDVVKTARLARSHLFCKQTPAHIVDACAARLQPESARAMKQMLSPDRITPSAVTTPMLILGARDDGAFTCGDIASTAAAYRTEPEFFPGMGHNMMLEPGWQAVADRIVQWLGRRGL